MAKISEYIDGAPTARPRPAGGRRPVPVHALRHPRLPGRPRRRKCSRTRAGGARREPRPAFEARDGGAARARPRRARTLRGAAARASRRGHLPAALRASWPKPQFLGYDALAAPARILALVADGAPAPEARPGRDRRGHPRPHAGLRGVRRPDRRHRRRGRPRRAGRDPGHLLPRQPAHRAPGRGDPGTAPRGRGGRGQRGVAPAPGPAAAPHRHAPAPRRAPQGAGHPRGAGRLAGGARPPALRLLARRRRQGQRGRAGRGASSTSRCRPTSW